MHGETRRGVREFVGARIRKFREARGLSLRGLCDRCDIPELMIGQMERGSIMIKFENLLCLARALEVSVVDFFSDDEGGGRIVGT
jgi:transcriptional regulator with XRE-family HTH domain